MSVTNRAVDLLLEGQTVITATQRLSRHLRQAYDRHCQQCQSVWPTADVLSLNDWVLRSREEALVQGLLPAVSILSTQQEQVLWERVIASRQLSEPETALLNGPATAKAAARAYGLAKRWNLDLSSYRDDPSPDVCAFVSWSQDFERLCHEGNWQSAAMVTGQLAGLGKKLSLCTKGPIHLLGFDRHDRASERLFDALKDAGINVFELQEATSQADVQRLAAADAPSELEAATQWAWRLLKDGESGPIGIVVPDLAARRTAIESTFSRALHPPGLPEDATVRLFNISQGGALAEEGVVQAALSWIRLAVSGLDLDAFSDLIRSPHIGVYAEQPGRARFDLKIRAKGMTRLRLPGRKGGGRLGWPGLADAPDLSTRLGKLAEHKNEATNNADAAYWARWFGECLKIAQWPGDQGISSREYQAVERFRLLLDQYASLAAQAERGSASQALSTLSRLARETLFQPQSGAAPVQILGMLEAGGLEFSHLWVLGLAENVWPAPARPEPFLPLTVQRQQAMPHADPKVELAFARRVTERLTTAAPQVVFSHPLRQDEQELAASPLIAAFPEMAEPQSESESWMDKIQQASELETFEDTQGKPLPINQASHEVTGGTFLLKDQSQCPFRAYARHRLQAQEPEQPSEGPDAMEKGGLIHDALEVIWSELKDSKGLAALNESALTDLVEKTIEDVFIKHATRNPAAYAGGMNELEKTRVATLLMQWLEKERGRAPFKVVATEQSRDLAIGPLRLHGKIDRIDELENGSRVVMDYKTGTVSVSSWKGERPEEPQVPAYALAEQADGLCFAQVKAEKMVFTGLGREKDESLRLEQPIDEAKQGIDWDTQMAVWRQVLDQLAEDFSTGYASVDPTKKACEYCELDNFCRINQQAT